MPGLGQGILQMSHFETSHWLRHSVNSLPAALPRVLVCRVDSACLRQAAVGLVGSHQPPQPERDATLMDPCHDLSCGCWGIGPYQLGNRIPR
jgi:hypothetical protein